MRPADRVLPDCYQAVVLGGAVQPLLVGEERPRLHRDSDRVWEAARLWHAGCAPRVLVSAGGKVGGGYPAFQDLPRRRRWLGPLARIPGLGLTLRRLGQALFSHHPSPVARHLSPKALSLLELSGTWPGAWLLRRGIFMPWELPLARPGGGAGWVAAGSPIGAARLSLVAAPGLCPGSGQDAAAGTGMTPRFFDSETWR